MAPNLNTGRTAVRPIQRIIVVDDDAELAELIRAHFTQEGFEVTVCPRLRELFNTDFTNKHIMIIDINMSNNAGLAVVEQVKQDPQTASLGVIAYAMNMSSSMTIAALNAGADDYLLKPFTLRELSARVQSVLRHLA